MRAVDNMEFAEAMLLTRCRAVFGDEALPNGQPIADALASAMTDDLRASEPARSSIAKLSDAVLRDAGLELSSILEHGGEGVLPFGTGMKGEQPGSVEIAQRVYVMDADRSGLHPLETAGRGAQGVNLELLRELIAHRTRRLACRRIGLPEACHRAEARSWHLLRFAPLEEAGGVVLQCQATTSGAARFCAATPTQIDGFAAAIVEHMKAFWKRRREIARCAGEIRLDAATGIELARGTGRDVRLTVVAIDMEIQREQSPLAFHLEYQGIDEALRDGPVLCVTSGGQDRTKMLLGRSLKVTAKRVEERRELLALGADGRIEDIAAGIARAAPEGQAAVLERLATELETIVVIPSRGLGAPLYATLFWQDGTIRADVSIAGILDVWHDCVQLRGTSLAATMFMGLIGTPLSEAVALPFDCSSPIMELVELPDGVLQIVLDVGTSLVNTATGEIWPEQGETESAG